MSFPRGLVSFPGGANGKEPTCQYKRHKRHSFDPWAGKIPLEEDTATHSSIHAWRIPWAEQPGRLYIVHSVTESERLKQFSMHSGWLCGKESACNAGDMGSIPELGEPLQKEMATHSSIFVWEIPWREEYGG